MKKFNEKDALALLVKYKQHNCIRSRDLFIAMQQGLAVNKVCSIIKNNLSLDYEDALQEANIALIIAIDKFDLTLGYKFSSFAAKYISGYVYNYIRRNCVISIKYNQKYKASDFSSVSMTTDGGLDEEFCNDNESIVDNVINENILSAIKRLLSTLPKKKEEFFRSIYFEGLVDKELRKKYSCSPANVRYQALEIKNAFIKYFNTGDISDLYKKQYCYA